MLKNRKLLFSLALILGAGLLAAGNLNAYAEEEATPVAISDEEGSPVATDTAASISLLPTTDYVALKADNRVEKELTITNDGNTAYRFRLYAQPYTIDDSNDQYFFAFNTMNSYTSIYQWVSFETESGEYAASTTYYIEPGESKTITYRVDTPAAVPAGGQYAAIFAETINEDADTGNINGIYTASRVALLLYGRSDEGVVIDSEIFDYKVPSFLLNGPITATVRVKSLGNIDVTATYKMIVKGIFGNELYANTWAYSVLPETERYVAMTWKDTPAFGIYNVQFAVSTADHVEDHNTIVLILPIYIIIITILVLTIIIVWIIIMLKKRKERKSRLIV